MADLTNSKPKDTYQRLVQVESDETNRFKRFQNGLGSPILSASFYTLEVANDLYVRSGSVYAQSFITTYTTSSTLFQSGSTKFGDGYEDVHEFTGSIKAIGSLAVDNGIFQNESKALGSGSVAIGAKALAQGNFSVAIGNNVTASGAESFAQGINLHASGEGGAHAEGGDTLASGYRSHAEGYNTSATGFQAHSEGESTLASGTGAHAEGFHVTASGNYQHASGKYNIPNSSSLFIIGNGTSNLNRSNVLDISNNSTTLNSSFTLNGTSEQTGDSIITGLFTLNGSAIIVGDITQAGSHFLTGSVKADGNISAEPGVFMNPKTFRSEQDVVVPANHNAVMFGPISNATTIRINKNSKLRILR